MFTIRKDVTVVEIKETLEQEYGLVEVDSRRDSECFNFYFEQKDGKRRNVFVLFGDVAFGDYQIDGVLISMGCFGESKEIAMLLLNKFGGYFDENDCDDKGFVPINIETFEKAKEVTEKDKFINKVK